MQLEKSFLRICFTVTLYLTSILALSVFGYFNKTSVAVVTAVFIVFSIYFIIRTMVKPNGTGKNLVSIITFLVIAIFSLYIGYFHHDLPIGRDDLSYIYAADRLALSGSLEWEDYFTRPVHGVRSLGGDTFTSQFLPAYTSYLAVYEIFGGLDALMMANVLLMFLTLGVFYYLVKTLAGRKASLTALILMLSSYVFIWFPKRTNVENISIFLIWFGIWLAALSIKKEKPVYLFGGLIPLSLMSLARPEGLIFLVVYLVVAVYILLSRFRKILFKDKVFAISGILLALINLIVFYFYIIYYEAGYILTQATDVFESFDFIYTNPVYLAVAAFMFISLILLFFKFRKKINYQSFLYWFILLSIIIFEAVFVIMVRRGELTWIIYRTQYVFENFVFYFYFINIFIILIGLRKKIFTQIDFIVVALLLPAFFFIIEPNIALDQPWFMRRFFPTLIPLFIILSAIVLTRLNLKISKFRIIIVSLVVMGVITARSIFFFVENDGLQNQVEQFNQIFPKDSLILMNPGWAWQKIALLQHYFYGYDALPNLDLYRGEEFKKDLPEVYAQFPDWEQNDQSLVAIMNWEMDKSEQYFIDLLKDYSEVYVVTNEPKSHFFKGFNDDNLQYINSFVFNYNELSKGSNITGYIQQNKIIDIKEIRIFQNNVPPSTVNENEIELFVYRVNDTKKYVPFEYVLEITDNLDKGIYYSALKEVDLNSYRKKLRAIVVESESGLD